MILTVTLNAALDVTYPVASLVPHSTHRVESPSARAGGKGVNVARVLHGAGEPVLATGLAGGVTGALIRADLRTAGVPEAMVYLAGESRRTVAVVAADTGDATLFNEPGPRVSDAEWAAFLAAYDDLAGRADVVVCSGSLPPGVATDAYAELVTRAGDVPVIVDASGPSLVAAAAAGAALLKPNLPEAVATTGQQDPVVAGRTLRDHGADAVVVSAGADGLVAVTRDGSWRATPPAPLPGNPTGAGDASVAALAAGLRTGIDWPARLCAAVAWSAGAVAAPLAGDVDATTRDRTADAVRIKEIDAPHTDR